MNAWKRHNLTPIGKITVVKTLAISKLNHLFIALPTPDRNILKKLESLIFGFIWNGKPDKINRKKITLSYSMGGLNMVEISKFISALKVTWVHRMYLNNDAPWVNLASYHIKTVSLLFKLGANYSYKVSRSTTNKFWSDVLLAWADILQQMPTSQFSPKDEPLWLNPNLSRTELYLSNWSRKGVASISDIMFNNGQFLSESQITKAFNIKTNYLEYHGVISCTQIYLNKTKSNNKISIKPAIPNKKMYLQSHKKDVRLSIMCLDTPRSSVLQTPTGSTN